jgi:hypothetical protein
MNKMYRSNGRTLPEGTDLLTAVKNSMNYEADLYVNGYLLSSWMGLPMEENIENLAKEGITTYVQNGRYQFKYTDESKNVTKYYVETLEYQWEGTDKVQFNIGEYRSNKEELEFNDIESIKTFIEKEYLPKYSKENINVVAFLEKLKDGCEFNYIKF